MIDIVYQLDPEHKPADISFQLIWQVNADENYRIYHPNGFHAPSIFITHAGTGVLTLIDADKKKDFTLAPGTVFIIDRGIACRYACPPGCRWHFHFMQFSTLDLVHQLGLQAHELYHAGSMEGALRLCESIINEIINREHGFMQQAENLFRHCLVHLSRQVLPPAFHEENRIKKLIHWMHHKYDQNIDIDSLVELSGMNRTTFFSEFKKETGTTPNRYLMNIRLDVAAMALKLTGKKIVEIAAMLGFYDEYHFSKAFRARFGASPSQYRRDNRYEMF